MKTESWLLVAMIILCLYQWNVIDTLRNDHDTETVRDRNFWVARSLVDEYCKTEADRGK